jgi:hypothetical protein
MKRIALRCAVITLAAGLIGGCVLVEYEPDARGKGGKSVTLCHKGKKTLVLPEPAVQAHLNHGDRYGPCR